MRTSTELMSVAELVGAEKAVELIAKAGFDAWDYTMLYYCACDYPTKSVSGPFVGDDYLKIARRLRRIGEDCGIVCNQTHAPFPTDWPSVISVLKRAVESTAEVGATHCVIHPCCYATLEENRKLFCELVPFANSCGVKIATENMYFWNPEIEECSPAACATPESFCEHVDAVGDPAFVACLDIGHAQMKGSGTTAVELIRALGHRLECLHLHDNDCRHDSHAIPFSMNIEFEPVVKALKEIGYRGDFTLEACNHLKKFDAESAEVGVRELYASVRRLVELFELA